MTRSRNSIPTLLLALCCACLLAVPSPALAEEPADDWQPRSEFRGEWDWVQIRTGEWLKGRVIVMYDGDLEFDSDEFDTFVIGWHKITQLRTSQVVNIGLLGRGSAVGKLVMSGDTLMVYGDDEVWKIDRKDVLTITAGEPKELNYWTMKVFAGLIVRTGNTEVRELNVQANFKRRTILNRILIDFVLNQNTTDGTEVSSNQRAQAKWDTFVSDRFYVTPIFGEYFRDPFQNIDTRYTVGVGVGYDLIDSPKVEWSVSGGPAYQQTRYNSVIAGQDSVEDTPALTLGTRTEWDILRWLEFDGSYQIQLVNEQSGEYNHHLVASFESEITGLIDFDISWIWDRVQNPRPDENGIPPQQDDFRTTVGLTFEF